MNLNLLQHGIKEYLANRKISYLQLAKYLKVSEPTIKRTLNGADFSVNRLLAICNFLDLKLSDLENRAITSFNKIEELFFTTAQESFLAKNLNYYYYFKHLHEHSAEELAAKYSLSKKTQEKFLVKLERLNLIERTAKNKVKIPNKDLRFIRGGELANTLIYEQLLIYNRFIESRTNECKGMLCNDKTPKHYVKAAMCNLEISKIFWDNWWEEFVKMINKLVEHSAIDKKMYNSKQLIEINFAAHATALVGEDKIHFAQLLPKKPENMEN